MVQAGGGKIINIGSMTSIFGSNVSPAYGRPRVWCSSAKAWRYFGRIISKSTRFFLGGFIPTRRPLRPLSAITSLNRAFRMDAGVSRMSSPAPRSSWPALLPTTSQALPSPSMGVHLDVTRQHQGCVSAGHLRQPFLPGQHLVMKREGHQGWRSCGTLWTPYHMSHH